MNATEVNQNGVPIKLNGRIFQYGDKAKIITNGDGSVLEILPDGDSLDVIYVNGYEYLPESNTFGSICHWGRASDFGVGNLDQTTSS